MNASGRTWIVLGGLFGGLGVVAGAFGAHGLEKHLSPDQLETYEVAVRYQMYHALALVLVGLLAQRPSRMLALAGSMFVLGILIFSGLLYVLVFTGVTKLGMIVPLGGLAFIAGWFSLAAAALRRD
jgi:uncharacterized membrane protein YgdD (TMEM256/DUF423 family)